jgi:hypothetical protein
VFDGLRSVFAVYFVWCFGVRTASSSGADWVNGCNFAKEGWWVKKTLVCKVHVFSDVKKRLKKDE